MKFVATLMLVTLAACNDLTAPFPKDMPKHVPSPKPTPVDTTPTPKQRCERAGGIWNERRTVEIYTDSLGVIRERYIPGCMYMLP